MWPAPIRLGRMPLKRCPSCNILMDIAITLPILCKLILWYGIILVSSDYLYFLCYYRKKNIFFVALKLHIQINIMINKMFGLDIEKPWITPRFFNITTIC